MILRLHIYCAGYDLAAGCVQILRTHAWAVILHISIPQVSECRCAAECAAQLLINLAQRLHIMSCPMSLSKSKRLAAPSTEDAGPSRPQQQGFTIAVSTWAFLPSDVFISPESCIAQAHTSPCGLHVVGSARLAPCLTLAGLESLQDVSQLLDEQDRAVARWTCKH